MNERVKKLWVDALRSREYKQGHNQLRTQTDCYCCLGVLCELYRIHTGNGVWLDATFRVGRSASMAQLPDPVRIWAGLDNRDPYLAGHLSAVTLNDCGKPFDYIAEQIEKYL